MTESVIKADVKDRKAYDKDLPLAGADAKNRLELALAKHEIRIACEIAPLVGGDNEGTGLRPVSNTVEIAVSAPAK